MGRRDAGAAIADAPGHDETASRRPAPPLAAVACRTAGRLTNEVKDTAVRVSISTNTTERVSIAEGERRRVRGRD